MHESGLIAALLRQVETQARAASARRVVGIELWVGALSGFSEAHLREHFVHEAQGGLAFLFRLEHFSKRPLQLRREHHVLDLYGMIEGIHQKHGPIPAETCSIRRSWWSFRESRRSGGD